MDNTLKLVNLLTPKGAKSKIDKFSKIIYWVILKKKQLLSKVLLNSFPINGHKDLSIESKARTFSIAQGLTLGIQWSIFLLFLLIFNFILHFQGCLLECTLSGIFLASVLCRFSKIDW